MNLECYKCGFHNHMSQNGYKNEFIKKSDALEIIQILVIRHLQEKVTGIERSHKTVHHMEKN